MGCRPGQRRKGLSKRDTIGPACGLFGIKKVHLSRGRYHHHGHEEPRTVQSSQQAGYLHVLEARKQGDISVFALTMASRTSSSG